MIALSIVAGVILFLLAYRLLGMGKLPFWKILAGVVLLDLSNRAGKPGWEAVFAWLREVLA